MHFADRHRMCGVGKGRIVFNIFLDDADFNIAKFYHRFYGQRGVFILNTHFYDWLCELSEKITNLFLSW